jgi:hypothetical protein
MLIIKILFAFIVFAVVSAVGFFAGGFARFTYFPPEEPGPVPDVVYKGSIADYIDFAGSFKHFEFDVDAQGAPDVTYPMAGEFNRIARTGEITHQIRVFGIEPGRESYLAGADTLSFKISRRPAFLSNFIEEYIAGCITVCYEEQGLGLPPREKITQHLNEIQRKTDGASIFVYRNLASGTPCEFQSGFYWGGRSVSNVEEYKQWIPGINMVNFHYFTSGGIEGYIESLGEDYLHHLDLIAMWDGEGEIHLYNPQRHELTTIYDIRLNVPAPDFLFKPWENPPDSIHGPLYWTQDRHHWFEWCW